MNEERDISKAHPRLQKVFKYLIQEYPKRYPGDPVPFLTQVYRKRETQEAYYAQGREGLTSVNTRRKKAGLPAIQEAENKIITKARPGLSKHERTPAEAFDIAFVKKGTKRTLDWSERLFAQAYQIIKEADPLVRWGKYFSSIVDLPHFEI